MKRINWGILGPGRIAHKMANDAQYCKHARIKAVASRNLVKAKEFAKKFNIKTAYGSYDELYQDPEIQAIYIATPHNFHFEQAKKSLEAGKAVLCEKPITINEEELKELRKIASRENTFLMEGMWTYFLPVIQKVKQWIDSGRIGTVYAIKSDFGFPMAYDPKARTYNPELAGGALLDMGIYPLAMAWLFFSQFPKKINATAQFAPTGVDTDVNMLLEYEGGHASLHTSFVSKLPNHTYIYGDQGYIDIPNFWGAWKAKLFRGEKLIELFEDDREGFGFLFELEAASIDILQGKIESSVMPLDYSQKLQEIMEKIAEKIRESDFSHVNS